MGDTVREGLSLKSDLFVKQLEKCWKAVDTSSVGLRQNHPHRFMGNINQHQNTYVHYSSPAHGGGCKRSLRTPLKRGLEETKTTSIKPFVISNPTRCSWKTNKKWQKNVDPDATRVMSQTWCRTCRSCAPTHVYLVSLTLFSVVT